MKKIILAALWTFLILGCGNDRDASNMKIIGGSYGEGNQALKGSYPSTISFISLKNSGGDCSATRIGEDSFLTAAHCFPDGEKESQVSISASNGLIFSFQMVNVVIHPSFSSLLSKVTTTSDLATFSIRFKTIKEKNLFDSFVTVSPIGSARAVKGEELTVTGFGCENVNIAFKSEFPWITVANCAENNSRRIVKYAKSKVESETNFSAPFSERYFTLHGEIGSNSNGYIGPGDSGGGVFNSFGQVVGVNTMMIGVDGVFLRTIHASVAYPDAFSFISSAASSPTLWQDGKVSVVIDNEGYEGFMLKGMREGEGTQNYKDGKSFTGSWHNDVRAGFGRQIWPSGGKYMSYEGNWANDLPNGYGTLSFTEGFIYTGELKDGKLSGKGTMKFPNGDIREGNYVNGKREGEHILTDASGKKYLETYLNDQRTSVTPL